ncbi:hypothetical protein [Asticcacaulis sp. 201]|uniref:hypothetical protein n=1 Tax=Asticcacaulis sp. 201 TaxID=3028787 RepID=UPI002916A497|nr:hypothetical protein [Asticcacaulis sp. 201]MDV6331306.1 hypothetical protein [Asticcacaulis sp. 201]
MTSVALLLLSIVIDPTHSDRGRLDTAAQSLASAPRVGPVAKNASFSTNLAALTERPIFVMSTGANAYTEKAFQLFGVSISSDRRAALVSIDGAPATWVKVGELRGDVQLIDVSASTARFDTPIGERSVTLNDPAPSASAAAPAG